VVNQKTYEAKHAFKYRLLREDQNANGCVSIYNDDDLSSSSFNVDDELLVTNILFLSEPFWIDSLICPEKNFMTTTWFA
jgi:hypothetical protein